MRMNEGGEGQDKWFQFPVDGVTGSVVITVVKQQVTDTRRIAQDSSHFPGLTPSMR
jgi:hypothetical protein